MLKMEKLKLAKPMQLNYDSIYIFPASKEEEYVAVIGDTKYTVTASDIEIMCDKINEIGCTSFHVSKEEVTKMLKHIDTYIGGAVS